MITSRSVLQSALQIIVCRSAASKTWRRKCQTCPWRMESTGLGFRVDWGEIISRRAGKTQVGAMEGSRIWTLRLVDSWGGTRESSNRVGLMSGLHICIHAYNILITYQSLFMSIINLTDYDSYDCIFTFICVWTYYVLSWPEVCISLCLSCWRSLWRNRTQPSNNDLANWRATCCSFSPTSWITSIGRLGKNGLW